MLNIQKLDLQLMILVCNLPIDKNIWHLFNFHFIEIYRQRGGEIFQLLNKYLKSKFETISIHNWL